MPIQLQKSLLLRSRLALIRLSLSMSLLRVLSYECGHMTLVHMIVPTFGTPDLV